MLIYLVVALLRPERF
ncbi:K(+)-transporting ATPase subunit F [Pseudonocardia sp. 1LY6.1]